MKLTAIPLRDARCRKSFAQILAKALDEDEDWRYVTTPKFTTEDYIVSDRGRVISLPRYRTYDGHARSKVRHKKFQPGVLMRPGTQSSGHQTITIVHNKQPFRTHIHRLVAWAFLGPQPPEHFVRHLDGNPANNRLSNLSYVTSWNNVTDTSAPAGPVGTEVVVGSALERRIRAALRGEADPGTVLEEIITLVERSRRNNSGAPSHEDLP